MGGGIIGGGIAGLSAALFAKKFGLALPVYEQRLNLAQGDHLIWLAPNGLALLDMLGLSSALQRHITVQDDMSFNAKNLRPIMSLRGEDLIKSTGFPIVAIKRSDLYQVLLDEAKSQSITIHYTSKLTHVQSSEDDATVTFSDGTTNKTAFVLCADGMGSHSRKQLFPSAKLHYQGLRTYLGMSRDLEFAQQYVGRTLEVWGIGTRFVFTSLNGKDIYWSALERCPQYEGHSEKLPSNIFETLNLRFSSYHPHIQAILAHADQQYPLTRWNFSVVQGLSEFHRSRVALLGDAAHGMPPNMGQGASLALEDSYALAYYLTRGSNVKIALRNYSLFRVKRVAEMRRLANSMNLLFQPPTKFQSVLRDCVFSLVPDSLSARRMGKLYLPHIPDQSGEFPYA